MKVVLQKEVQEQRREWIFWTVICAFSGFPMTGTLYGNGMSGDYPSPYLFSLKQLIMTNMDSGLKQSEENNSAKSQNKDSYPLEALLGSESLTIKELHNSFPADIQPQDIALNINIQPETKKSAAPIQETNDLNGISSVKKTPVLNSKQLKITITNDNNVIIEPKELVFEKTDLTAKIDLIQQHPMLEGGFHLFVRDQNLLSWNADELELRAKDHGNTEIYCIVNKKMYIIPVSINGKNSTLLPTLSLATSLMDLNGIWKDPFSSKKAIYNEESEKTQESASEPAESDNFLFNMNKNKKENHGLSIQDAKAKSILAKLAVEKEPSKFYQKPLKITYRSINIQLIDERSDIAAEKIYPLDEVKIKLIGTEFIGITDATGQLTIKDVPQSSSFLLSIWDPIGRVQPEVVEISSYDNGENSDKIIHITAIREFTFEAYQRIAGTVQDVKLGSMCSRVIDGGQKTGPAVMPGIEIKVNVEAEGPYYFNRFGFLDPSLKETSTDGRFCFFNLAPGPITVSFVEKDQTLAMIPVAVFSGKHLQEDFDLTDSVKNFSVKLAAEPTSHEELGANNGIGERYRPIDYVDIFPLGEDQALIPRNDVEEGVVEADEPVIVNHDKVAIFSQAAEFEPVIYTFPVAELSSQGNEQDIVPLVPRGFVEDMSLYAQIPYDPILGVVLVEHGDMVGSETSNINIKLINLLGEEVGAGWYFGDHPITKAIFFNVPPGTYQLIVETEDKYWLAAETIMIYNETVSFVRTGSQIKYNLQ